MSAEEYKKIVAKGRRFLMEYLLDIGKGDFSDPETMKSLFRVIGDEYRALMHDDEEFYRSVEAFCSKRRALSEKQAFCRGIMTRIVTTGNVHRRYAKKCPDYVVPEKHKLS